MATLSITLEELDAAVIAYVEWHKHAQCVQISYDAWRQSEKSEQARRFAAYLEELDREQRACELYEAALVWSRNRSRARLEQR
jgi:hypothetical protein